MRSSVLDGAARQGLKGPPGPYSRTAGGMSLWCGDLGTRSSKSFAESQAGAPYFWIGGGLVLEW